MNPLDCIAFRGRLLRFIESETETLAIPGSGCAIKTPFFDNVGDPIYLAFYGEGARVRIEDTGAIAGHLFTLGQHMLDTPAFRLLEQIAEAYGLTLDFDRGTVKLETEPDQAVERAMDLLKAVITMVTATPFIRVIPHRVKPAGPRLKTRIKRAYYAERILELVQDDYELPGQSGVPWPIDFHWWVEPENDDLRHIYVVAADFNVLNPLVKANHVATLSLDAKRITKGDNLRVVVDHTRKDSRGMEALSLLRTHSDTLGFRLYNFDEPEERTAFIRQSVREITEKAGESWRRFWIERSALAFAPDGKNGGR